MIGGGQWLFYGRSICTGEMCTFDLISGTGLTLWRQWQRLSLVLTIPGASSTHEVDFFFPANPQNQCTCDVPMWKAGTNYQVGNVEGISHPDINPLLLPFTLSFRIDPLFSDPYALHIDTVFFLHCTFILLPLPR